MSTDEPKTVLSVGFSLSFISEAGTVFTENVFMPLKGQSTLFSRQVLQPYRTNVRPVQPGLWTLTVTVPYSGGRELLRGLGLTVSQKAD